MNSPKNMDQRIPKKRTDGENMRELGIKGEESPKKDLEVRGGETSEFPSNISPVYKILTENERQRSKMVQCLRDAAGCDEARGRELASAEP
jgi:hypothetical protein